MRNSRGENTAKEGLVGEQGLSVTWKCASWHYGTSPGHRIDKIYVENHQAATWGCPDSRDWVCGGTKFPRIAITVKFRDFIYSHFTVELNDEPVR